ncbi:MAG: TetR/AcrR family transcriptional regulator [Myxococcaceae bacterium]|nr:TetR/AcrR family transcriptional regulator [Myxococcaceae bacterium]
MRQGRTAAKGRRPKRRERRDLGRPRGEPVRVAVLAATLDELATTSLEGLSIDRVAKAAQVNKTSVYRRWPTREALVVDALEWVVESLSFSPVDTGSIRGDLQALGEAVVALLEQPIGRGLTRAALGESLTPEVGALLARQLKAPHNLARSMVGRAVARGEWQTDEAAEAVLAMLVGGLMHRVLIERRPAPPAFVAQLVGVLSEGAEGR